MRNLKRLTAMILASALSFSTSVSSFAATVGDYIADDATGAIGFSDGKGGIIKDSFGLDGCYYNENGEQVNSLYYVWDKYSEKYENAEGDEFIRFDNPKEYSLFVNYIQLERSDHQGEAENISAAGPNTYKVSDLKSLEEKPLESYKNKVAELSAKIDPSLSIQAKIYKAETLVQSTLHYDYDGTTKNSTMDEALTSGIGVCYHFAKLLKDILTSVGVNAEYVVGYNFSGDMHAWIRSYGTVNNRYKYSDPSLSRPAYISGYTYYLINYKMFPLV